MSDMSLVVGS